MSHAPLTRRIAILALTMALSPCVIGTPGATAAPAQGERQREEIAKALRAGETRCVARSGRESGDFGPGMMNGGEYGGFGHRPRAMMSSSAHSGPELSTLGGALIAIVSAAVGAGVAVLWSARRRQPPPGAAP